MMVLPFNTAVLQCHVMSSTEEKKNKKKKKEKSMNRCLSVCWFTSCRVYVRRDGEYWIMCFYGNAFFSFFFEERRSIRLRLCFFLLFGASSSIERGEGGEGEEHFYAALCKMWARDAALCRAPTPWCRQWNWKGKKRRPLKKKPKWSFMEGNQLIRNFISFAQRGLVRLNLIREH